MVAVAELLDLESVIEYGVCLIPRVDHHSMPRGNPLVMLFNTPTSDRYVHFQR